MNLPFEIKNKILLYNIHPIAKIFKELIKKYNYCIDNTKFIPHNVFSYYCGKQEPFNISYTSFFIFALYS
jgi:hypothetical protein